MEAAGMGLSSLEMTIPKAVGAELFGAWAVIVTDVERLRFLWWSIVCIERVGTGLEVCGTEHMRRVETACGQQNGCSGNPNVINTRQKNLLQQLPDYDSSIKISKGGEFKRFSANGENG
jgi:hypothetical protein